MEFRKVTAIIRSDMLVRVEDKLNEMGVKGFTLTTVKGCGEYANFYKNDMTSQHSRVEIFIAASRAEEISEGIMDAAHMGLEGDGVVAVLPVERLYRIRTKSSMLPGDAS